MNNDSANYNSTDKKDTVLMTMNQKPTIKKLSEYTPDTWIADTGASCHITNEDTGMYDTMLLKNDYITVADEREVKAIKIGKLDMMVLQENGERTKVTLTNVKYVPDLAVKLFSLTAALDHGMNLGNQGRMIFIWKNDLELRFDIEFEMKTGFSVGVRMKPVIQDQAQMILKPGTKLQIQELHGMLGHASMRTCRETAKYYGWIISGQDYVCDSCAKAKAKQRNISKEVTREEIIGKKMAIDISSIQARSYGGSKFWLLMMDDASDYCWSEFLKNKSELADRVINKIRNLKAKGIADVKVIRCDNAGENISLKQKCEALGLGITFEFTARYTPQQNGRIEQKFAT